MPRVSTIAPRQAGQHGRRGRGNDGGILRNRNRAKATRASEDGPQRISRKNEASRSVDDEPHIAGPRRQFVRNATQRKQSRVYGAGKRRIPPLPAISVNP